MRNRLLILINCFAFWLLFIFCYKENNKEKNYLIYMSSILYFSFDIINTIYRNIATLITSRNVTTRILYISQFYNFIFQSQFKIQNSKILFHPLYYPINLNIQFSNLIKISLTSCNKLTA